MLKQQRGSSLSPLVNTLWQFAVVTMTIECKLRLRQLDFLHFAVALDDRSDDDLDVATIRAAVDLRRTSPATVEQGAGRRHTGRRRGGLGAADACQRADGQFGLCPRQRSNICRRLSLLGSLALPQPVRIFA